MVRWCKLIARIPLEQKMGMPPDEKLRARCVNFTHITVEVMGPYMVPVIKQRTEMKVWVASSAA